MTHPLGVFFKLEDIDPPPSSPGPLGSTASYIVYADVRTLQ